MKIKNGFVLEQIGDSYVAVALGEAASTFRGFVKMNKTGAFLWNLLTESDLSIDEQERDRALTSTVIRTHSTGTVKGQHPGTVMYTE